MSAILYGITFTPNSGRLAGVPVAYGDMEYGKPWLRPDYADVKHMAVQLKMGTPSLDFKVIASSKCWVMAQQATEFFSGRRAVVDGRLVVVDESKATYEQCMAIVGDKHAKFLARREQYRQAAVAASAVLAEQQRLKDRRPIGFKIKKRVPEKV